MNSPNEDNFILTVHGNADVLEILNLAVDQMFLGTVRAAKSGPEAIAILEKWDKPVCIISEDVDSPASEKALFQYVQQKNIPCPFIVCTNKETPAAAGQYSGAYGVIHKPDFLSPLKQMLENILKTGSGVKPESEFSPIRLSVLLRLGFVNFDLYMRLSSTKFVKVAAAESEFVIEDAQKLIKKNVIDLYLRKGDAEKLLREFQQNIMLLSQDNSLAAEDMVGISSEAYEMTHTLSRSFGWSSEVQDIARQGTQIAVKAIAKNPRLLRLLTKMNNSAESYLATHSHLLTYVCCGAAKALDWTSDYTFTKLAMAALIHDITLSSEEEQNIKELNAKAYDSANTGAEVELYRSHPTKAVLSLGDLKNLPPDIDKIVIQHHERPDGRGFPFKVSQSRINPLATLFIVAEDLVDHLIGAPDTKAALREFITTRRQYYTSGHFLKVFKALETSLEESAED